MTDERRLDDLRKAIEALPQHHIALGNGAVLDTVVSLNQVLAALPQPATEPKPSGYVRFDAPVNNFPPQPATEPALDRALLDAAWLAYKNGRRYTEGPAPVCPDETSEQHFYHQTFDQGYRAAKPSAEVERTDVAEYVEGTFGASAHDLSRKITAITASAEVERLRKALLDIFDLAEDRPDIRGFVTRALAGSDR